MRYLNMDQCKEKLFDLMNREISDKIEERRINICICILSTKEPDKCIIKEALRYVMGISLRFQSEGDLGKALDISHLHDSIIECTGFVPSEISLQNSKKLYARAYK